MSDVGRSLIEGRHVVHIVCECGHEDRGTIQSIKAVYSTAAAAESKAVRLGEYGHFVETFPVVSEPRSMIDAPSETVCATCGGSLTTENFVEATITSGPCGYSWASHFGGGEVQTKPCKSRRPYKRDAVELMQELRAEASDWDGTAGAYLADLLRRAANEIGNLRVRLGVVGCDR